MFQYNLKKLYFTLLFIIFCINFLPSAESADTKQIGNIKISKQQNPHQIGEKISINLESPEILSPSLHILEEKAPLAWAYELKFEGASYISPHFSHFLLPEDAYLIIRSMDRNRQWIYKASGENDGIEDTFLKDKGFWGIHIPGDVAVIELYTKVYIPSGAIKVDVFARGFNNQEINLSKTLAYETDDSKWASCYQNLETEVFEKATAVGRIIVDGTLGCTAFLVGDEGHVLTNNHCMRDTYEALNTNFEFMAQGSSCKTDCSTPMACAGEIVATSSTLVKTNPNWDYSLIKLPVNLSDRFGSLKLRERSPEVNERIYIPHHPNQWGKKIAVVSTPLEGPLGFCNINSLNILGCNTRSDPDLRYVADRKQGSSGSPIIAFQDHLVVGLHHCTNTAIPITRIISDLGPLLPASAFESTGIDNAI